VDSLPRTTLGKLRRDTGPGTQLDRSDGKNA
jgi:hypothetical protein